MKFLQWFCLGVLLAEHVYSDSRLLLCGTSGGLGGWGVRHLSGLVLAVWSALMISSAITWWKCGSEWSVYCHLFHCCLPFVGNTWPSVSSFLGSCKGVMPLQSGQILVWHPRCSLEWLLTVSRFPHVTKVRPASAADTKLFDRSEDRSHIGVS